MGFPPPPSGIAGQFGYTTTDPPSTGVLPGQWIWPFDSEAVAIFATIDDTGTGPSGSDWTVDVSGGLFEIFIPDGGVSTNEDLPDPIAIGFGTRIKFEITSDGGATGVITFGFTYRAAS
jgi:hypothetical protein